MLAPPSRWKATRRSTSYREAFARRSTVHARPLPEWTCGSAVGADTIQQYLREGLIDEMHIAIAPVLLGRGKPLFEGVDLRALGHECVKFVASEKDTHV